MIMQSTGPLSSAAFSKLRNLGVIFDQYLSFDTDVKLLTRSCFFRLRQISKLRTVVSTAEQEMLIHAFISFCIDYYNALFSSLSMSALDRLQQSRMLLQDFSLGQTDCLTLSLYLDLFTGFLLPIGSSLKFSHLLKPCFHQAVWFSSVHYTLERLFCVSIVKSCGWYQKYCSILYPYLLPLCWGTWHTDLVLKGGVRHTAVC